MADLARPAIVAPPTPRQAEVLTPAALDLLGALHARFEPDRQRCLAARSAAQARFDRGELPTFLEETREVREASWTVRPAPADLTRRIVEITGPCDRKMMVNALNSGADCFMADLEDATSPTWTNLVSGQANLMDAVRGRLEHTSPEGRRYTVGATPAVLLVRPRGWHLPEPHARVAGEPMSGSLFDAGLFLVHNAAALVAQETGPYLYLPKLESHDEASLWDAVLAFCEERLGLPVGTVRVTVLVETLPAAFQMEEILWALRGRCVALNAGRWDYLFSALKVHRAHPVALPDRDRVTMEAPFLRAYARLLVATCHKRGAHALGGMAAFLPNRRDPDATVAAVRKVREDKEREAEDGFDGTWVAHPDLVPVARAAFERRLRGAPNQLERTPTVVRDAAALLDLRVPGAATEAGVRHNLRAALLYLAAWLDGTGAVALDNRMEDAATAEISRTQLWHWRHHAARLADGRTVDPPLLLAWLEDEEESARMAGAPHRLADAVALLRQALLAPELPPFLTLLALDQLETP